MIKARTYVKSVKSRAALACAFLLRAWGKWQCRRNQHADQLGVWSDLHIDHPDGTTQMVGDRIVWTCARCGSSLRADTFAAEHHRLHWQAHPERRRVTARDWSR